MKTEVKEVYLPPMLLSVDFFCFFLLAVVTKNVWVQKIGKQNISFIARSMYYDVFELK